DRSSRRASALRAWRGLAAAAAEEGGDPSGRTARSEVNVGEQNAAGQRRDRQRVMNRGRIGRLVDRGDERSVCGRRNRAGCLLVSGKTGLHAASLVAKDDSGDEREHEQGRK